MIVETLEELRPSKVIAIHLNFRSRADERGRIPTHPSYFLKPPSSLSRDGEPVVRPCGCELLCYEGELAAVIGRRARHVAPSDALGYIAGYTAANDFGVYDLRWADRGSNLLAKGQDGFTPIGPVLVPAAEIDPRRLRLRTLVNGEVVQDDSTEGLLFPVEQVVADLARFITLEPGDLILLGTPANSRPVKPGDVVEVEIDRIGRLRNPITAAEAPLQPYGAMPDATDEAVAAAWGTPRRRRLEISSEAVAALRAVSTATLTVQLARRGLRNTFMKGPRPLRPDLRMVGYAHTLRYVPLREDLPAPAPGELNAQKQAIETIEPGDVLVIDARGETGAGTIGDILAARARARGAAGIVSDGAARDTPALSRLELPTYSQGAHAAVLGRLHHPLEAGRPVACGGVLVLPGDVIVGDAEGVVVVPAAVAEEVARDALAQEEREEWALKRVEAGESIRGVYPLAPEREAEFEEWKRRRT